MGCILSLLEFTVSVAGSVASDIQTEFYGGVTFGMLLTLQVVSTLVGVAVGVALIMLMIMAIVALLAVTAIAGIAIGNAGHGSNDRRT